MRPSIEAFLDATRKFAEEEGLRLFGLADLQVQDDFLNYKNWLGEGRHGSMEWMTNHLDIRRDPQKLLPGARTALVFGFNYYLGDKWVRGDKTAQPKVAQYARLPDYHKFMRVKLQRIQNALENMFADRHVWRITVDSAPLLERALAAKAGDAFIGKNTCLIHPQAGSFFLLGEILTSWDFGEHVPVRLSQGHRERSHSGGCGSCRRCQVHCPTGALDQDYKIDARKCISYWTIEHRGEIPVEYWPWVGRYIFGCDICQLVCPYNRKIDVSANASSMQKIGDNLSLGMMARMDQAVYEQVFSGTPMTRAKRSGLRRNAIIAGTVRGETEVINQLDHLQLEDDPLICSTATQAKVYLKNLKTEN